MSKANEKYVYKRSDGRWEARYVKGYSCEGRPVYAAVYGKTKAEVITRREALVGTSEEKKVPTQLNLLILGAGTHGSDIKEIAEGLRIFKKISFLDDKIERADVIGKCKDALKFRDEYSCAFIAIGDNKVRKKYAKFLKERNFLMPNIISPMASVSPNAILGEGIGILPQSSVGAAQIGDFCIVSTNGSVATDAIVNSFCHVDCGGMVLKDAVVPEGRKINAGEIIRGRGQYVIKADVYNE